MKTATYKKISQKGLSPIIIVIILAIIVVGGFIIYNSQKSSSTYNQSVNNQQSLPSTQTSQGFNNIDGQNYVFYFPNDYIKAELGKDDVLNYKNSKTKAIVPERIFLKITKGTKNLGTPNYQLCLKAAELERRKQDDEIKAEVASGNYNGTNTKGVGCKIVIKSKVEGVNDALITVEKDLWSSDKTDYSIYIAGAVYYENASKDEAQKLEASVDQFTLK